jgi:lysophospholipase L1-like esterase
VADADLLWRFKPGSSIHGQAVNAIGFPEREVAPEKRPGAIRVICLGDSCTADAVPPYPTVLHSLLTNAPPSGREWEAFHNAVHGYSVVQGLTLFRKTTRHFRPDVVTVYFGWNDHWAAPVPDRVRMTSMRNSLRHQILQGLQAKRFYQLLFKLLRGGVASRTAGAPPQALRVPPDDYRRSLLELVREIRESGATPILLTAPRARTVSADLAERTHGTTVGEIHDRHDRYIGITRSVARETEVLLLDLAAEFESDPLRDTYFTADGVHLTAAGRRHVAGRIYDTLASCAASSPPPASAAPAPPTYRSSASLPPSAPLRQRR